MLVSVTNLITGECKVKTLKAIAKYLNIPECRLKQYRIKKTTLFDGYAISFNVEVSKQHGGNKDQFKQYHYKRMLALQADKLKEVK